MPRVSVIIPTYDRADVLPRAMDSVLAQTMGDLELIVVDDGSEDETPALVRAYGDPRVEYVSHEENRGGSAARNTGIERASGEYLAFLDSDDTWRPRKLEAQLAELESRSEEWIGAYCDAAFVTTGTLERLLVPVREFYSDLTASNAATEGGKELVKYVLTDDLHTSAGSTLVVEREVVEAIGGFDETFDRFQDPEFLIRVLKQGKIAHVRETLVDRYESADPPVDAVREADEHYLETFSDTIDRLEARGYDIRSVHQFMLARLYFNEGRFMEGAQHLAAANKPTITKLPSLLYSVATGLHTRLTMTR